MQQPDISQHLNRLEAILKVGGDSLWSTREIGEYLKVSSKTAAQHIVNTPGFPGCIVLPTGGRRWHAAEVREWAKRRR